MLLKIRRYAVKPSILDRLKNAKVLALFCVEEHPAACHRSLAAEYIARILGSTQHVEHL
jgi:hypothetical protein